MEFIARLHQNKKNGQINLSIPKRKLKLKKVPKYIEIKEFNFID